MDTHKLIRKHLTKDILLDVEILQLQALRGTEWSYLFERLMRNRLLQGAFRYGKINKEGKSDYDRLDAIRQKVTRYEETGNDELLVDISNLAMVEFEEGRHPKKHFHSMDDVDHLKESK